MKNFLCFEVLEPLRETQTPHWLSNCCNRNNVVFRKENPYGGYLIYFNELGKMSLYTHYVTKYLL